MTENLLFVCAHNSARSQMAEGLLRHYASDPCEAFSAGTEPGAHHPLGVHAMAKVGIDINGQSSQSVDTLVGERVDLVITVCDQAREACPLFPSADRRLHWTLPDPAAVQGTEEERLGTFRRVRDDIAARARDFVFGQRAQEAPL